MLRQKLYKLKQEQGVESEPLFPIIKREPVSPSDRYAPRGERGVQASPVGTLPSVARGTSGRHGCHLHPASFLSSLQAGRRREHRGAAGAILRARG